MDAKTGSSSINQRLNLLVDTYEKGKKAAFARKVGISPQAVQEMLSGRQSDPSYKVLVKILESYPQVRIEWLVMGSGEILPSLSVIADKLDARQPQQPQAAQMKMLVREAVSVAMTQLESTIAKNAIEFQKLLAQTQSVDEADLAGEIINMEIELRRIRFDIEAIGAFDSLEEPGRSRYTQLAITEEKLQKRVLDMRHALALLHDSLAANNGSPPTLQYRLSGQPDKTKPFDGLLAKRLGISDKELSKLIKTHKFKSVHIEGAESQISEAEVRKYLELSPRNNTLWNSSFGSGSTAPTSRVER